jgi:hypothetical protein
MASKQDRKYSISLAGEYLVGAELRELLLPEYDSYMTRYRNKYGKDYSGRGVVSVRRELIGSQHRGAWHKVMDELGIDEKR